MNSIVITKEQFAFYLEETAAELRGFTLTREYIYDVCDSLIKHTMNFKTEALEEARLKICTTKEEDEHNAGSI